jgi:hypothetical protein
MGLSFAALTNAALGGGAAWEGGKREGRRDKIRENQTAAALARQVTLDQMNAALHQSQIAENEAQRQEALQRAAKLKYDLDNPKAVAPVLGTPEYRKAQGELSEDRAKSASKYRTKQEWEVYGPSGDRGGSGGVSAGDQRAAAAKKEFIGNWVAASGGDPHKALALVERTPSEKEKAAKYGVTRADWLAAESEYKLKRSKSGSADAAFDDLSSDGTPVATASSSAPQPPRPITSNATAQALESTIPTLPPAVVRGQAPVPTSTPKANPMRANSPKAGTPDNVPAGADPDKYRSDKRYRMWVDSISKSK